MDLQVSKGKDFDELSYRLAELLVELDFRDSASPLSSSWMLFAHKALAEDLILRYDQGGNELVLERFKDTSYTNLEQLEILKFLRDNRDGTLTFNVYIK